MWNRDLIAMQRFQNHLLLPLLASIGCGGGLDATLEANPACDLSAVVTWETSEPSTSWVEFGDTSTFTHRIGSDALTTEHEVIVVGMHAASDYTLRAVSETESGKIQASADLEYTTGDLPGDWLAGDVDVYDRSASAGGWNLVNAARGTMSEITAAILDMSGAAIWYYTYESRFSRADVEVTFDGEGILIGPAMGPGDSPIKVDLKGEVLWTGPTQPGEDVTALLEHGTMHHVFHQNDDGQYVTVAFEEVDDVLGDRVLELDEDLNTVWSWSTFDHLVLHEEDVGTTGTWTHVNSVATTPAQDAVVINAKHLNNAYKVDRATGDVLWAIGLTGDFEADTNAEHPWFEGAHAVDVLENGNLILYDNGESDRGFSRVIEYALDETAMTSEIVWEYPGTIAEDSWQNLAWGDVDILDNGNVFIVAGAAPLSDDASRLFEVDRDGTMIWQMWWDTSDELVGSYAAERIPALAEPL